MAHACAKVYFEGKAVSLIEYKTYIKGFIKSYKVQ
jgi:hypothetical protein